MGNKILKKEELETGMCVSIKLKNYNKLVLAEVRDEYFFKLSEDYVIEKDNNEIEQIMAIPLQYEHLLKFEFIQLPKYDNYLVLKIGNNTIVVEMGNNNMIKKVVILKDGQERIIDIHYLHQL
jgi:hypothetical protein